ncbi:PadR family transcriptional regulator [soil metagenome]
MTVARTLLGLLEPAPAHGYTLKKRYDAHFSRLKPLPFGQVYASLARFERDGLAETQGVESGDGPERKLYAITPDGVTVVKGWMYSAEEPTAFASSTLFAKTALALLSGRSARAVLDAQRQVHLIRMRELTESRRLVGATEVLAISYELNHLDADLRWIEEAGHRLDALHHGLKGQANDL